jgi:hypothetical protein
VDVNPSPCMGGARSRIVVTNAINLPVPPVAVSNLREKASSNRLSHDRLGRAAATAAAVVIYSQKYALHAMHQMC